MENKVINCFIIMPFSKTNEKHTEDYWTDHFENFLKPTIEQNSKINVFRSSALRGDILKEIISNLIFSSIVIADLTDANPNVYWELGIRQSFMHGTVTIAEFGTKLPFDISVKGTLFYHPTNYIKNATFSKNLLKAIQDCIDNPQRPDSNVLETIAGKGSFYDIFQKEENKRKISALISEHKKNIKTYKNIKSRALSNQKNPSKKIYGTQLFRTNSIELLISHQYLNTNKEFYGIAEQYYDHLNSINNKMNIWSLETDLFEKWIIRIYNEDKYFNNFLKELMKILLE